MHEDGISLQGMVEFKQNIESIQIFSREGQKQNGSYRGWVIRIQTELSFTSKWKFLSDCDSVPKRIA